MSTTGQLTVADLLAIEKICDRFEDDLNAGRELSIESYVAEQGDHLQEPLRAELKTLRLTHARADIEPPALPISHQPHQLVDRFRLIEQIGRGATSTVWKASDDELGREIALKIPHREGIVDSGRFVREARLTAQLRHPHIVQVYEAGQTDGLVYLVSELITGSSLEQRLNEGPLSVKDAVTLLIQITDALAYSHRKRIIHRDLKPQNVLIDDAGQPHITDFGLARSSGRDEGVVTKSGEMLGTPAYMAPEQATGDSRSADARTDIYSVGVIMFQMLTRELPFRGTLNSVVYQIVHSQPPAPQLRNSAIPTDLNTICLKCLEKEPQNRFQSAEELRDELIRFRDGRPILSRPVSVAGHLWKWSRRNPRLALLAFACTGLLAAVATISTWTALRLHVAHEREMELRIAAEAAESEAVDARNAESQAKAAAMREAERAREEAVISERVVAFLESVFRDADSISWVLNGGQSNGARPSDLATLFKRAAERIRTEMDGQPRIQARLMDVIGNACRGAGEFGIAEELLTSAREIRSRLIDDFGPTDQLCREELLNSYYRGWLAHNRGNRTEAEALYTEALSIADRIGESEKLMAADVCFQMGRLLVENRDNAAARPYFEKCLLVREQLLPPESQRLVIAARIGLAFSSVPAGEEPPIEELVRLIADDDWSTRLAYRYAKAVTMRRLKEFDVAKSEYAAVIAELRSVSEYVPLHLLALGDYAGLLFQMGDYRELLPVLHEVIERGNQVAPNHRLLIGVLRQYGFESLRAGHMQVAEDCYRQVQQKLSDTGREENRYELQHAFMWCRYADGQIDKARAHVEQVVDSAHAPTQAAWAQYCFARVLEKQGDPEAAQQADTLSHQIASQIEERLDHGIWLERLALIHARADEHARSEELLRLAVESEEDRFHPGHPRVADRLMMLANTLKTMNRVAEAIPYAERANEIFSSRLPETDGRIRNVHQWLVDNRVD